MQPPPGVLSQRFENLAIGQGQDAPRAPQGPQEWPAGGGPPPPHGAPAWGVLPPGSAPPGPPGAPPVPFPGTLAAGFGPAPWSVPRGGAMPGWGGGHGVLAGGVLAGGDGGPPPVGAAPWMGNGAPPAGGPPPGVAVSVPPGAPPTTAPPPGGYELFGASDATAFSLLPQDFAGWS
ncbi:unnamed protein product [Pedinophyceae sp. YPF-701]|nr:unnamed protein product [Pedinophyceae sp. YPF-701]